MRSNLLDSDAPSTSYQGSSFTDSAPASEGVKKYFDTTPAPITRRTLTILIIVLAIASILILSLAISLAKEEPAPSPSPPSPPSPLGPYFASTIQVPDLWRHLNSLQTIADANFGTRAIGGPGFNATVDYIYTTLKTETSLDVFQQTFLEDAWFLNEPSVSVATAGRVAYYTYQTDYHVLTYSGSVNVINATLVNVNNGGCTAVDWRSFPAGAVALLYSTTGCSNPTRANLATNNSASAIMVYQSRTTRTFLPGGVAAYTKIGAFLLPYNLGITLSETIAAASPGAVTVTLALTTTQQPTGVTNTCATSRTGDVTNTIISGAHCDSVPAGSGVNDNGSGTTLNLALALALDQAEKDPSFTPLTNRVRFCWWAAEEVGLRGSQYYVTQAVAEGLKVDGKVGERIPQDIQVNLNYDIVGSPNFVFGVWDGDTFTAPNQNTPRSINGSLATTRLYETYFNKTGLTYSYRPLDNRSDYRSFHNAGVAAGGATSGREDLKTLEERNRYARLLGPGHGGIPGVAYDPCYHQRCDQVGGVNPQAILNLTHAGGYVLEQLARMTDLRGFLQYPTTVRDVSRMSEEDKRQEMEGLKARFAQATKEFLEEKYQ